MYSTSAYNNSFWQDLEQEFTKIYILKVWTVCGEETYTYLYMYIYIYLFGSDFADAFLQSVLQLLQVSETHGAKSFTH